MLSTIPHRFVLIAAISSTAFLCSHQSIVAQTGTTLAGSSRDIIPDATPESVNKATASAAKAHVNRYVHTDTVDLSLRYLADDVVYVDSEQLIHGKAALAKGSKEVEALIEKAKRSGIKFTELDRVVDAKVIDAHNVLVIAETIHFSAVPDGVRRVAGRVSYVVSVRQREWLITSITMSTQFSTEPSGKRLTPVELQLLRMIQKANENVGDNVDRMFKYAFPEKG